MKNDFQHVIVTGHGRSGTNLVLDLLDCSSQTLCRNEPNEVLKSGFDALGEGFFPPAVPDRDAELFGNSLVAAKKRVSVRDRFPLPVNYKSHFQYSFGLKRFMDLRGRRPSRKILRVVKGADYSEEWGIPDLFLKTSAFRSAVPVYKILLWSGRIAASHATLNGQKVIHVVRDPQSFIMSWYARYVGSVEGGDEKVFYDNMRSALQIAEHFGHDASAMRAFSVPGLIESELWRWRFVNEHLYCNLKGSPRYLPIIYKQIMSGKVATAERMADFCGLPFDKAFAKRVGDNENVLFKQRKDPVIDRAIVAERIETVMKGSPLAPLLSGSAA